jgi:hypothetical protein
MNAPHMGEKSRLSETSLIQDKQSAKTFVLTSTLDPPVQNYVLVAWVFFSLIPQTHKESNALTQPLPFRIEIHQSLCWNCLKSHRESGRRPSPLGHH